jgi:radical SAM protein with 4Fe4S-binding SPASM domain
MVVARLIGAAKKAIRMYPILSSIRHDGEPGAGPLEVMVDFNNSCNLHCLCCYNYSPLGPSFFSMAESKRYFNPDLFVLLLDDCAELGVGNINLAGYGEPLMHPDAGRLLEEIKARELKASIVTNGTLLTRYAVIADFLSGATVSIQAGSEEVYNRMHPLDSKRNWQRVLGGLELLRSAGIPTAIAFVLNSENYRDVMNAVDLAGRYRANLTIQPIKPFIRKEEGKAEFDPEQISRLRLSENELAELREMHGDIKTLAAKRNVSIYGLDDILELTENRPGTDPATQYYGGAPCYTGWYFSRVLMDGSVTSCCQCVGHVTLGNINEHSFKEIWHSRAYREFRNETLRIPMTESSIWRQCPCNLCDSIHQNRKFHRLLEGKGPAGLLLRILKPFMR